MRTLTLRRKPKPEPDVVPDVACPRCGKPLPRLAVTENDEWCSTECAKAAPGVKGDEDDR